jgi:hypothetical protein
MSICIECRRLLADSQVWRRRAKEADARAEEFEEELVTALGNAEQAAREAAFWKWLWEGSADSNTSETWLAHMRERWEREA